MSSRRLKAYTMLLSVVAIWGIAGPVIKFTLEGIDPLPFITYRLLISALISVGFFAYKIKKRKKFRQLRQHLPLSILYGFLAVPVGLGFLFFALDNTTVLDLTLTSIISPLLVTAGGAYFFRDHITKREKIGISIVLVGVLLNSLFPLIQAEGVKLTANLLLFAYLASDVASVLLSKKISKYKIKSSNLSSLAFIVGFVTIIPLTLLTMGPAGFIDTLSSLPLKYHFGVWYMALLSGNLAYYLFVRAQKSIEVSEAVLFSYLQPVITIPLAIFWLKEELSAHFVMGAIIIAIGLYVAETKKSRYNTKR